MGVLPGFEDGRFWVDHEPRLLARPVTINGERPEHLPQIATLWVWTRPQTNDEALEQMRMTLARREARGGHLPGGASNDALRIFGLFGDLIRSFAWSCVPGTWTMIGVACRRRRMRLIAAAHNNDSVYYDCTRSEWPCSDPNCASCEEAYYAFDGE